MRFQSYFNTAVLLIRQYDGNVPLVHFLKQYFGQNKKYGSTDRKWISHICYTYYRIGHALKAHSIEERLKAALFLINEEPQDWKILFDATWLNKWDQELSERLAFIQSQYPDFSIQSIFPWITELSEEIDATAFILSHFIQPDLFLRIRQGNEKRVLQKLTDHKIPFQQLSVNCIALPNATKIDTVLEIDKEVVIQDYSSQRIADFLQLTTYNLSPNTPIWDCCSASGGKTILAKDVLGNIYPTVSDIRPSILKNLQQRFKNAGIKSYHSFVNDLSKNIPNIQQCKLVICDVPCSGSGTWGRTPEQLYFFSEKKIAEYADLQKKIVSNAISLVAPEGYFLFITCSVFSQENEEMANFIEKELSSTSLKKEVLIGYTHKADTMFASLFQKA